MEQNAHTQMSRPVSLADAYAGSDPFLEDVADTLVQNGMFRNRDHFGLPISGSNADFLYDGAETEEFGRLLGLAPCNVHFAKRC